MPLLSVIAPVYNNREDLRALYEELVVHLSVISRDFEVIFVDDRCPAGSWSVITELSAEDQRVKGVQLSRNFGQQRAITAGIDLADGDWVVVIDADLQDHPRHIPEMYRRAISGELDVVVVRWRARSEVWFRSIQAKAFYRVLSWLSGTYFDPQIGNFRIMSRRAALAFASFREQSRSFVGIMKLTGFEAGEVEVDREPRYSGTSSYTFRKRWQLAMDIVVAYSDKPLKFSIALGVFFSGTALVAGVVIIGLTLFWKGLQVGWPSLIVSIYLIGGLTIANLGLLGVYIGKIYDEVKGRPLYILGRSTRTLSERQAAIAGRVSDRSPTPE